MRDEDKSREELIMELQTLRKELSGYRNASSAEDVSAALARDQWPEPGLPGETADLAWDIEDAYFSLLDDVADPAEPHPSGRWYKGPDSFIAWGEFFPRNLTETGSFDLTWMTKGSIGKLLQAIPIPVALVDVAGHVQFANNAMLKMAEDPSSILHASFSSFFPGPQSEKEWGELLEQVLVQRRPQLKEGMLVIEDKEHWCRINLRVIRIGKERSVLTLIEDLTAEKRELSLNEKYRRLVEIFPVGIAEFRLQQPIPCDEPPEDSVSAILDAQLTDGNIQFARLNGHETLGELLKLKLGDIFPCGARDLNFYRKWVEHQFTSGFCESKEQAKYGDIRYFETTLVGNVYNGAIAQFWAMKQDITDHKRAQEELINKLRTIDELYEHIVQSGKAKAIAAHTANVAHELRQPLAIIGGFARRMVAKTISGQDPDIETRTQWCEIIIGEVARLEKILGKLIDYGRHDRIQLRSANPNDLVQYVLHINEERLKEKALRVELNLGRETGEIPLDPEGFQKVVRNLIANAIEASAPGGAICIHTSVSVPSAKAHETGELDADSYFEMKIRNFGRSIPAEDLARIFDPFFTHKKYGTGLGLTLSKNIVEEHRGSVSVKSDDKNGTVFTVWLPMKPYSLEARDVPQG